MALIGPAEAQALRLTWSDWIQTGKQSADVRVNLVDNEIYDQWAGKGRKVENWLLTAHVRIGKSQDGPIRLTAESYSGNNPNRHVWSGKGGWFAASYGPFRRFAGGDKDFEKLYYSHPQIGRHLSLFGESVALSECLDWLQQLQFKALEAGANGGPTARSAEGQLLDKLKAFVNQSDFLPYGARIDRITSSAIEFIDGNGTRLPVNELSDGYRSILSMTFELIRQLSIAYDFDKVFKPGDPTTIVAPGVVLVDEIDVHLHPSWQRKIGFWLREHFPNIQFIVTTHSPLVCQAAAAGGSVFRLARPGGDAASEMLAGDALNRVLYGNVLDAYDSRAFGEDVGRSDLAQAKRNRLAELNQKELEEGLSPDEQAEQVQLRLDVSHGPLGRRRKVISLANRPPATEVLNELEKWQAVLNSVEPYASRVSEADRLWNAKRSNSTMAAGTPRPCRVKLGSSSLQLLRRLGWISNRARRAEIVLSRTHLRMG